MKFIGEESAAKRAFDSDSHRRAAGKMSWIRDTNSRGYSNETPKNPNQSEGREHHSIGEDVKANKAEQDDFEAHARGPKWTENRDRERKWENRDKWAGQHSHGDNVSTNKHFAGRDVSAKDQQDQDAAKKRLKDYQDTHQAVVKKYGGHKAGGTPKNSDDPAGDNMDKMRDKYGSWRGAQKNLTDNMKKVKINRAIQNLTSTKLLPK